MIDIKHVWFDLVGTLLVPTSESNAVHRKLLYDTYVEAVGRPLSPELEREYDALYQRMGSNSAAFRSLGKPSDFWMKRYNTMDQAELARPNLEVNETLGKLRELVPISLFTNDRPENISRTLKAIGTDERWFRFVLSGDDMVERKPDLGGFRLMITRSGLPAEQILYVGDRVKADIRPAKEVGLQTALVWSVSDEADYSFERFEDLLGLFRE